MKVEVVSKESIKPSRPTPHHLKFFKLAFLDQLAPPVYVNVLLYYGQNDKAKKIVDTDTRLSVIKKSLAETLTKFYPLAGKIIDDEFIVECNDEGVDYIETKVSDGSLSQLIQHPNVPELVKKFIPSDPYSMETSSKKLVPLLVQVNVFEDCGGIVVGIRISHKMADASSLTTFVNDWATVARGIASGDHGEQIKDLMGFKPSTLILGDEVLVTKKFVFGSSKLAELKAKSIIVKENDYVPDHQCQPTRVEVLSAFLWKSTMVPSMPTNFLRNVLGISAASIVMNNTGDGENGLYNYPKLVGEVRDSIKKVDADYVKLAQTTDAQLIAFEAMIQASTSGQAVMLNFSSWCRFPLYESDFVWGKPTWVSTAALAMKNMVMLMDTSYGDGIEAWVHLSTKDMAQFERHEELLTSIFT
ncbi:hypothetical protein MKW94_021373 [Papaver nudicaule]|uniref:Uncharacterized protein n=1 Tax=Papaver nudicaule TaxID=74823 RepID=A0AA41VSW7_PAPNU|nr:hypothetical protein [Papaver nudicaule]